MHAHNKSGPLPSRARPELVSSTASIQNERTAGAYRAVDQLANAGAAVVLCLVGGSDYHEPISIAFEDVVAAIVRPRCGTLTAYQLEREFACEPFATPAIRIAFQLFDKSCHVGLVFQSTTSGLLLVPASLEGYLAFEFDRRGKH